MLTRIGKTTGKRCHYRLLFNGIDLGTVRGVMSFGHDKLMGRRQPRSWGYEAGGRISTSKDDAERHLLARQLTLVNSDLTDAQKDDVRAYLEETR